MGRKLETWSPEDGNFWRTTGRFIAKKNLLISIPCLFFSFALWMVWSVLVVYLPNGGFSFTRGQLFWLVAAPSLSGTFFRILYSFTISVFGGRTWTVFSTGCLVLPALGMGFALGNPHTPYGVFLLLAVLCGMGGGNFASSMANISLFFPKSEKGVPLGLNAGIGNLGVSATQVVVPLVIGAGIFGALAGKPHLYMKEGVSHFIWLQNAGFVWVLPLLLCAVLAWIFMDDLENIKAPFSKQIVIIKRPHTWLLCLLYLGVFGSFIGFSAVFALLVKTQFPAENPVKYAFLGPLLGSLWRVAGGWAADKFKGSQVLIASFLVLILGTLGALYFLPGKGLAGNFEGFLAMFLLLFTVTGIGSGACSQMMPVALLLDRQNAAKNQGSAAMEEAEKEGSREGAAVLGFAGAIGAFGGFFIPQMFSLSLLWGAGSVAPAFYIFIGYYLFCIAVTWFFYARSASPTYC